MITLYKGDDTGGQLGKNVKIMFHCDDAVDMDDVVVKFDLLGIVKREFTDVHDGDVLDIFISHAESRKFPLGVIFAKMWGEDASGKLRTFANRIPFRVTLNLIAVYGSDGTDSQDIHVYSSVDWDSIANKPTVFPSSVGEVEGLQGALDEINEKIPFDASADNQLADKEWVDQEIDRVAAYYITSDAQGNPFQTRAALLNAETYYSGGSPRTPTRNDYAIVLADESHDNAEWRYIYSENDQGVGVWEAQYPVEGAIVADDNVTKTSTNPVKSSGIWAAIWGALAAIPSGFTSLYDWVVAQLRIKRDYTDLSYNTQVTVNAPALHAILTSRGTQLLEYYLPCTEVMPATPQINHVYTWRKEGAEFYITQGVSVYSTSWKLFNSSGEQLSSVSTDNATQGLFPDLEFSTSAYSAVSSVKVDEYPGEVHDTIALRGDIPTPPSASTATPAMDGTGSAGSSAAFARGDHVHPTDTSRMAATATGADIAVSGSDPTKIAAALAGKANKSDVDPMLFAQYYPEGNVQSAAEFTQGIKYNFDTANHTATVRPFCNTGDSANDNSGLVGRVVIPPFVDSHGNPYISDDGTRYKVVGVSVGIPNDLNRNLTAIVAPNTVMRIEMNAFETCNTLASVSLPAATTIEAYAFHYCYTLASVSLPAATTIGYSMFSECTALVSISLPAATTIEGESFLNCSSLTSVDFGDTPRSLVPTLGEDTFIGVPTSCKIIVPDAQYDAWTAASGWSDLVTAGYKFLRHSEWEYARKYEVDKKADKPATFTTGNLAQFDPNGNPTDSGVKPSDKLDSTSAAPAFSSDSSVSYPVGSHVTYNGKLYKCTTATTGGTWDASKWTADTMTDPDAVLDITAQNQLRVVAKDGTVLWAQGYDLASTSSATLACDATNNFTFADGATTQAFTLPTAPTGKVGDFGLDIDNSANTGAATMTLTGLDTTFSVVVPKGESLTDMLAIAAGELARFYITLSSFRINNLPTWHIMKQIVENGGATV